jgi:predicted nucleic acid-binding protein
VYLLDTNIILEFLLDQEKAADVERLIRTTEAEDLHLTEFALYSLGVVLMRRKRHDIFIEILDDLLVRRRVRLIRLALSDMKAIAAASKTHNLDFDDAYQYVAAEKRKLTIVSFDADFDRTPKGRKTPAQILTRLTS